MAESHFTVIDQTSKLLMSSPGRINGAWLSASGGLSSFKLYDALSATGTPIVWFKTADGTTFSESNLDVEFKTGLYAVVDANTLFAAVYVEVFGQTFTNNPVGA